MPRKARKESSTGIYHVMLRGINQQNIFHDDEDNLKLIEILVDCKKTDGFVLYGFCLMGNHIHLLIKAATSGDLGQIFKRIGVRYAYWYNSKYKRIGHLFQDRYKSEPVETDEYFLSVLRYIHQNPVRAGISISVASYAWSSYGEYIEGSKIVDTQLALDILVLNDFADFHMIAEDISCLEDVPVRLSDDDAQKVIAETLGHGNIAQHLENHERAEFLKALKGKGLSIRQISRLTGISKGFVEKA